MQMRNNNNRQNQWAGLIPLLFISSLACSSDSSLVMTSTEPDATAAPSVIRERAYAAAGIGFLHCLSQTRWPSSGLLTARPPMAFNVDWKKQASGNPDGYPYCKWTSLDYGTGPAAIYTAFNMKFLRGNEDWFNQYFSKIPTLRYLKKAEISKIQDNERVIRDQSLVFIMCFSPLLTRFAYYPGDLLFHGGESMKGPWLKNTPENIKNGRRTDHKVFADAGGLVAIINGTFIHHDNYSLYGRGGFRFGGFGFNFRAIAEPQAEMATAAIYGDGTLRMASYRNLPKPENIRLFVQNKFMILEDGQYGRDASPPHYTRYDDMIARSYLFRHETGVYGYMWTINLPPQIAAKLAHDAGIKDMMILDIHSPISCQVSGPGSYPSFQGWKDFKAKSFNFVPVFSDESAIGRSLVSLSRALQKEVQFDYRRIAFSTGEKDHFAVFLKDAPEAVRFRSPRSIEVTQDNGANKREKTIKESSANSLRR